MKTILVTIHNTFAVRNLLRSGCLEAVSRAGVRVVLLASAEKLDYYRTQFPQFIFEPLPSWVRRSRLDRWFKTLTVDGLHTQAVRIQSYGRLRRPGATLVHYVRGLIPFLLERLVWWLGQFSFWRPLVRSLYSRLPSRVYQELLDKYEPELVFAANMINAEDYRLLLEAKRRGIKTLGMILSWDNLTSKVFLQVFPDRLIVHNPRIKSEAGALAGYPAERVAVVGVPQYDVYFRRDGLLSRAEFCQQIGADPAKKIILYAASGKASSLFDIDIVAGLAEAIGAGRLPSAPQILVRPYPRYDFPPAKVAALRERAEVLIPPPVKHGGWREDDWEFDDDDLRLLINSLAHADVVLTLSSTFLIEGAIFDKPTISTAITTRPGLNYWYQAERLLDFEHLDALKDFGAFKIVRSLDELVAAVGEALVHPDAGQERRRALVLRQDPFADGHAAERLAGVIRESLN